MYNASNDFKTKIKDSERMFIYSGSIVTTGGVTYSITGKNIRSGKITRSISGSDKLEIGTVYASEFDCELNLDVSRYELYGATITLSVKLDGVADVIPMGIYTIAEINQTMDRLNIKAYDSMTKFDSQSFALTDNVLALYPYEWLSRLCEACGVVLGSTQGHIALLPNGRRRTGLSDCVADIKTYRDVLRYLTAYLGAYAYIGRDGKLYLGWYKEYTQDTIAESFRYTSGLSDFRTTYDGLYAIYKDKGVQEYVGNENNGGLVLDLGTNPFLQFSNEANRKEALQEIIDSWNGVYYVPYSSSTPFNPLYDPGDIIQFTGNQADQYDYGAITEVVCTIGGPMSIVCSGDNPKLADAQDRFSKTVEGLSADYSNGQEIGGKNFWLLHTANDEAITVGSTKQLVAEIEWDQKVDVMRLGLMYSCSAYLSDTATVVVEINVDDNLTYTYIQTTEKAMKGKRPFDPSRGFRVTGKGTHTAKVYMTVTDNPTLWSDMV